MAILCDLALSRQISLDGVRCRCRLGQVQWTRDRRLRNQGPEKPHFVHPPFRTHRPHPPAVEPTVELTIWRTWQPQGAFVMQRAVGAQPQCHAHRPDKGQVRPCKGGAGRGDNGEMAKGQRGRGTGYSINCKTIFNNSTQQGCSELRSLIICLLPWHDQCTERKRDRFQKGTSSIYVPIKPK